ncbi:sodium:proton antiporter NhaD [Rapidithrix thailandica]|uniref:Sodium:proton antiporter NhaD n=1 Tax=Rapidithrix thailandica TaxID=413964 RepID=A0AAW9SJK2_9BACT
MVIALVSIFLVGYLLITLEHNLKIDKAAPSLLIGILTWTIYIIFSDKEAHLVTHELYEYVGEIAGVLLFLLGAMTIVELIDAHEGFEFITNRITTNKNITLLWITCLLSFFLSAALDNLTTTIVMVSILRKLVKEKEMRMFFVGIVVVAANAGGAWSPIGDVTTTMLWINGQITSVNIITNLIIPSLICMVIPVTLASCMIKGNFHTPIEHTRINIYSRNSINMKPAELKFVKKSERMIILFLGVGSLLFVPVFKSLTHLPPFMGILFSLGFLWLVTEIMHKNKMKEMKDPVSVIGVLRRVDVPSVLFFFGILVAISSLQATGILKSLATFLDQAVGNVFVISMVLGLLSAIVDNVPLVAAAIGMYDLAQFPTDHLMWQFIAYCAGTGGSALIIGSAAGVAAMGMEKIPFGWYLKKISWLALIGYFVGAITFLLMQGITFFH